MLQYSAKPNRSTTRSSLPELDWPQHLGASRNSDHPGFLHLTDKKGKGNTRAKDYTRDTGQRSDSSFSLTCVRGGNQLLDMANWRNTQKYVTWFRVAHRQKKLHASRHPPVVELCLICFFYVFCDWFLSRCAGKHTTP